MAITKVQALSGTAEVHGVERGFHWDGEDLTLKGLTYSEVTRVLDSLASGKLWDERPPVQEPATVTPKQESPLAKVAEALREKAQTEERPKETPAPALSVVKEAPASAAPVSGGAFELQKADSLLKVLTFLKGQGFGDWESLLKEATRLREDVPVLKKINEGEFKDRILRVANTKLQMDVPENA